MSDDPILDAYRVEIAALDQDVLEALNRRIALVQRLREHKVARGLDFVDPGQEARLLARLSEANAGPLSEAGLRAIFGLILDWSKRETDGRS